MRYGNPSLRHGARAAARPRGARADAWCRSIRSTPSSLDRLEPGAGVRGCWARRGTCQTLRVAARRSTTDPAFLDAFADVARPVLAEARPDHVLFSFHGLPERHMRKSDPTGAHCLARADCCDAQVAGEPPLLPGAVLRHRAGAGAAARARGGRSGRCRFQSRLGRTPWIKPYTDVVLPELAREGREAAGGDLPGVRRRLPGDAGGDRHPGEGAVPGARRRGARPWCRA